jgi:hypothetical protein
MGLLHEMTADGVGESDSEMGTLGMVGIPAGGVGDSGSAMGTFGMAEYQHIHVQWCPKVL